MSFTTRYTLIAFALAASTNTMASSPFRRELSDGCTADALEAVENNIGLDIIHAQRHNSYTNTIQGIDVLITPEYEFEAIDCAASTAATCDGNQFTIINDLTGSVLMEKSYTPGCRPNACIDNVVYSEALKSRLSTAGPSSAFWYSKNDLISSQCDKSNDCTIVVLYCGVTVEVPYDRNVILDQRTHHDNIVEAIGGHHRGETNTNTDTNAGTDSDEDHDSHDHGNEEDSSVEDAAELTAITNDDATSSSATLPIILGIVASAAVVAIVGGALYVKSQKKKAPLTETEFFAQYE